MTPPLHSPKEYLFNLYVTSSGEAKKMWRRHIKEQWNNECAYCGSEENLTIDHIIPRSKGGPDFSKNCLCACHGCNQEKGHTPVEQWYRSQEFFTEERWGKIREWTKPESTVKLYTYGSRRNNLS